MGKESEEGYRFITRRGFVVRKYPEVDGVRLRQLRLERALTQRELCLLAGVSQDALSRLENERRPAHPSTLRRLAEALGVQPRELIKTEGGDP